MSFVGIGKLGLKLIGTHAIMSIIEFFLMVPLIGLWDNQIYQWAVGIILMFFFWIIIYSDINYTSQNELKRELFWKPKGFCIGLIASIPALALYIATFFIKGDFNYAEIALRIWLAPYTRIFVSFENFMPHMALIPIILLPLISGLSYLDGPRKRKKILDAIDNSDAKRAEKSKVDKP